jgi:hypothetical protein
MADEDGSVSDIAGPDSTAKCPKCRATWLIGDASGFPVADLQFLAAMNLFWTPLIHDEDH